MPCGAIAGGTGCGRAEAHARDGRARVFLPLLELAATHSPAGARAVRCASEEFCSSQNFCARCVVGGGGWGFPSSARAGARLGRGVGLGLRERKLFLVSIIHRDKNVFSLAAIIGKKFCDKKIQLFLLLKPPGREEPRGKSPWASSSCPRLRSPCVFCRSVDKRSLCAQLCKIF